MAKEKMLKTNAMRILDSNKINYEILMYESKDGKIDGVSVAAKIGIHEKYVFKTLVAHGSSKEVYVFVIPVAKELNLKEVAIITGEKKIEMIHVNDIMKYTGYIRGGCSERFYDNTNTTEEAVKDAAKAAAKPQTAEDDLETIDLDKEDK